MIHFLNTPAGGPIARGQRSELAWSINRRGLQLAGITAVLGLACQPAQIDGQWTADPGVFSEEPPAERDDEAVSPSPIPVGEAVPFEQTLPTGEIVTVPRIQVAHARELRGVWIATVANINFPSRSNLSATAQRAELSGLVDLAAQIGLNALFFQVRPEGDALYASNLEPWSRVLTGTQGEDPGYDPLAYLIAEAHTANIEVHAWLNPYRAKSNRNNAVAANHIAAQYPEYAHEYGVALWMDPGADPVRERVVDVVRDLVQRYEVDGIHFDDYFYPYPESGVPFPDDATYQAYLGAGGTMSRDDWRRDNVHRLVQEVSEAIRSERTDVRFGISPFGIYRPGIPEGIRGLDQYAEIYSDPVRWMDEGWVDYLAPQLYWPTTQTAQAYGPLIEWWASLARDGRSIFAGNYLSKVGTSAEWSASELVEQVQLTRAQRSQGVLGNIFFHIQPFQEDTLGVGSLITDTFYQSPALTPPLADAVGVLDPPEVEQEGGVVRLSHSEALRAYCVYRADGSGGWTLDRLIPAEVAETTLGGGEWVVSAVARDGRESLGVPLD